MTCPECGADVPISHFCTLCDRCLKAKLWDLLEEDDYVLVRRKRGGGDITLRSSQDGDQKFTNLTMLRLGLDRELEERITEVFGE